MQIQFPRCQILLLCAIQLDAKIKLTTNCITIDNNYYNNGVI